MIPIYKISIPKSNIENVWAKMENQNPTGTHKDRSLGPWIEHYADKGVKELVISSSGNSAKSAAKFCRERGVKLHIFLKKNTPTPKKDAFRFAKERSIPYLRASIDDKALVGYKDIAHELLNSIEKKELPPIDNIFIPTSSGATLVGIYQGFRQKAGTVPALHLVQTTKVHPMASHFDKEFIEELKSDAGAIVDKIAHRKEEVVKIINETKGDGFVMSGKELSAARKELINNESEEIKSMFAHYPGEPDRSPGHWQSSLAFAGFLKWRDKNPEEADRQVSVCLFTD